MAAPGFDLGSINDRLRVAQKDEESWYRASTTEIVDKLRKSDNPFDAVWVFDTILKARLNLYFCYPYMWAQKASDPLWDIGINRGLYTYKDTGTETDRKVLASLFDKKLIDLSFRNSPW